ncbi:MAG: ABC transporter permease [Candidatus Nanopelagicales bacterium]
MIRRLLGAGLVIVVVSIVTFGIFQVTPVLTGASPAYLYVGKVANPAQVAAVEERLGLDKPIVEQYVTYMTGIVTGRTFTDGTQEVECPAPCFGYSFRLNTPVWELMIDRFPVTLSLAIGASILWLIVGLGIGILSALRRGSFFDRFAMIIALAGVSLPIYFTGLLLLYIFSYGPPALRWFPNVTFVPFSENPAEWARNLVLPWVSLAFLYAALYARLTRANMLETMSEDYIRTATAKGLPRRKVIGKHALRAALTPIVTIFALDIGALLGGAILTETTFSLPGLGRLAVDAIRSQDLPIIMGVTIFAAIFIVLANVVVDVLYGVIDPRVRYS